MQDHRAALRETGEDDPLGGDAPGALFIDERAMTWSAEAFNWSSSMARAGLKARMSYQLGMTQPPLTVTAWLGAWGG